MRCTTNDVKLFETPRTRECMLFFTAENRNLGSEIV